MSGARLPDAGRATVATGKVREYLLVPDHPDNGGKAAFFLSFGFSLQRWHELAEALRVHPVGNNVVQVAATNRGRRARVRCRLTSPDGRNPCITTVWAIAPGAAPAFITALPGPRPRAVP